MSAAQELHVLSLPLTGRQVIEASAGTGKTWTLAALYVRLVLAHGRDTAPALLPPHILVMTFTEAATAELRDRIRQRLSQAASYFDAHARQHPVPAWVKVDPFLEDLRHSVAPSDWPRCALQLSAAAEWMDDAAIYTIHGWSRRMLSQHALTSSHLFDQTHLENAALLQRQLTQDYWRTWFYPLPADTLMHIEPLIGSSPDALLQQLQPVWQAQDRRPGEMVAPTHTPQEAVHDHMAWQAQVEDSAQATRALWSPQVLDAIHAARAQGKISGSGITATNFAKWLTTLQAWAEQGVDAAPELLKRFGTQALADKKWPQAEQWPFFAAIEQHVALLASEPDTQQRLIEHAAQEIGHNYRQAKQQRAAFDFQDLLQQLHQALMQDTGELSAAIRQQYPVALVDEFQDTDPWQYGSLNRIYDSGSVGAEHALVMIGDPKQAIYSFRGADLGTYLQARAQALAENPNALHTLRGNRRSSAGLVNAVNHVFSQIDAPFSQGSREAIDFVRVSAEGGVAPWQLADGTCPSAMTVWHLTSDDNKPVAAPLHRQRMADVFADQMAALLNQHVAEPGQMAVLVRSQSQADAMREALRARGIPSVYLSDRSDVYATGEALDVWRVLRAFAAPRNIAWVRAALGSKVWALSLDEVLARTQDETTWENLLDQFHRWHHIWQQQGLLPVLHHWLHSEHIASRLLAQPDGERRLSNLLHLGELLQQAQSSLQGQHALVRFLEQQIQAEHHEVEAQKMRLETDAQCVQVITYHKSKGLQYPLVFVPFAGSFAYDKSSNTPASDDEEDSSDPSSAVEDMRLLYVALTRAERGLWLGLAETRNDLAGDAAKGTLKRSAVSVLLNRQQRGDLVPQLHALWGPCPDIAIAALPQPQQLHYRAMAAPMVAQAARSPNRVHKGLWWTASFSALTRGLLSESLREEAMADALTDAAEPPDNEADSTTVSSATVVGQWQDFPAGARYGTLLHDLLEWQARQGWPLTQPQTPAWTQSAWQQLLQRKTQWLQLTPEMTAQLTPWLQQLLYTPLPLPPGANPLVLQDLALDALWAEMEFHLEVHGLSTTGLDAKIQQHLFPGMQRPALQPRQLQGMLTGFMDLVVQHDGRFWVLDYKSNRLASYDTTTLQTAVLDKRYEVQYVLYLLAVHRLLKIRLPDYDYDQHVGGAVYLFLRGIDQPGAGVHVQRPPKALIEALDAAFTTGDAA